MPALSQPVDIGFVRASLYFAQGSVMAKSKVGARLVLCVVLATLGCGDGSRVWVSSWSSSMAESGPRFRDQTIRQVARVSLGGERVRIRLSNAFGPNATRIGAATIGLSAGGAAVQAGTLRTLTFGGRGAADIAPGEELWSDPVTLEVPTLGSVVVSLYLRSDSGFASRHRAAHQTAFIAEGDQVDAPDLLESESETSMHWLTAVEVEPSLPEPMVIVAVGDSITEGSGSTNDANARYPDVLAEELARRGVTAAVTNAGIGGNRLLSDGPPALGMGASGVSRFERDVLSQPGVTHVLLLEGVNDLGMGNSFGPVVSADEIIAGYQTVIDQAHDRDVLVLVGTLLPFAEADLIPEYWTPVNEAKRQAINEWIRTTDVHDGFVDFDEATRDPADPEQMLPSLHGGDFLHPNDAGYRRMGEAAADVLAP